MLVAIYPYLAQVACDLHNVLRAPASIAAELVHQADYIGVLRPHDMHISVYIEMPEDGSAVVRMHLFCWSNGFSLKADMPV